VVDGVKGCRNVEKAETGDLLKRAGRNKFIVQGSEKGFGSVLIGKTRLMWVEE